jgi:glycosyltransferase involved in cell wall biosynthesis
VGISLIITTYNRCVQLSRSLERLTHLTIPEEIIVVDDGSQDATEHIVRGFEGRLPVRYIYNHAPFHTICSVARNIGIRNSSCELIVTSEPELLWVTDILPQMMDRHAANPDHVISVGTIYHAQPGTVHDEELIPDPVHVLTSKAIVEEYEIQPRPYNHFGYVRTTNMTATFCAMYTRAMLMEIGGWDESFPGAWGWDDNDTLTRLRILGYNQVISAEMEAVHQFHEHLRPHIMGHQSQINEKHMMDKMLTDDRNNPNLIANRGREWGTIMPRP